MKLLITGANGFVGSRLFHSVSDPVALPSNVDLRDRSQVFDAVASLQPDNVIHLAAKTFVPDSFKNPAETFEVNFMGTLHLLEALKAIGFSGRFLFVGSAEVYGLVAPEMLPVVESCPLRPRNPYAVSKVAAEALCYQWSQSESFEVILARAFNHIGAGQDSHFAVSSFAKQIVEISKGIRPPQLDVGDIEVTRDFTDVLDVVEAYKLLLDRGKNGEIYNVCSGVERSIRSMLESLMEMANINARILIDSERLRRSEQRRVCGNSAKIRSDVGWMPKIPMESTLKNLLLYWERTIK